MVEKVTRRWRLGGYAPGGYLCRCLTCGETFEGDKRAISCLPCAAERAARPPWQPIDTAPRDGTHILVTEAHRGGLGYCGPVNIHGFRDPADWCDVVHWFDDPDEPGFYSTSWGGDQEHPFTNLTHWMPLPAAPPKKE